MQTAPFVHAQILAPDYDVPALVVVELGTSVFVSIVPGEMSLAVTVAVLAVEALVLDVQIHKALFGVEPHVSLAAVMLVEAWGLGTQVVEAAYRLGTLLRFQKAPGTYLLLWAFLQSLVGEL